MALVPILSTAGSIAAVNTYEIGDASAETVSTIIVHLQSVSAVGASITVKGRVRRATNLTYVAIPYRKQYLNGAVGDDTKVSVAITTDSILAIDASGLDIALDCTALTSGSFLLGIQHVLG